MRSSVESSGSKRRADARRKAHRRANRLYKKRIASLCEQVSKGNSTAANLLQKELDKRGLALGAVKSWKKKNKTRLIKPKPILSPEQEKIRERIQRQGFEEGASTPHSNLRKIEK